MNQRDSNLKKLPFKEPTIGRSLKNITNTNTNNNNDSKGIKKH
jgi:hypothetical protein